MRLGLQLNIIFRWISSISGRKAFPERMTPQVSQDSLLRHKPLGSGEIRVRGCSAIVQPESAEVLDAIRQHSRLKGYLEAGAPKGYLLIKQQSNPSNFVQRCKELGFKVTILQS